MTELLDVTNTYIPQFSGSGNSNVHDSDITTVYVTWKFIMWYRNKILELLDFSGYYMYHKVNTVPQSTIMITSRINFHEKIIISLKNFLQLIRLMKKQCILCAAGTEILNKILINFIPHLI